MSWSMTVSSVVSSYPHDTAYKASATTIPAASSAPTASPRVGAAVAGGAPGLPGAASGLPGGGAPGDQFGDYLRMQRESQQFNLMYLELQESMQRENRSFSALSNVLKARHETMRSSISNIK